VFLVCGYNDRPDISEGLAGVYLKFKQLKVPADCTFTPERATALACGQTTPNPRQMDRTLRGMAWRTVGF